MSRKPSAETQVVKLKRELRAANEDRKLLASALSAAQSLTKDYRARSTKAEQECAEWRQRFDLLLKRDNPPLVVGPAPFDPDTCMVCGGRHGANMPCPSLAPMCSTAKPGEKQ